jgi:ribonuclease P protein subunit RPR2
LPGLREAGASGAPLLPGLRPGGRLPFADARAPGPPAARACTATGGASAGVGPSTACRAGPTLSVLQHPDISDRGGLPDMPGGPPEGGRRGRRGRRTALTIRSARERISDLFQLAHEEWGRGHPPLSHRYVLLARRVGTRYNIRIPPEYRELYCRRCSSYWVEGTTVRTRLRRTGRVRTCMVCGSRRRLRTRAVETPQSDQLPAGLVRPTEREAVPAEELSDDEDGAEDLAAEE